MLTDEALIVKPHLNTEELDTGTGSAASDKGPVQEGEATKPEVDTVASSNTHDKTEVDLMPELAAVKTATPDEVEGQDESPREVSGCEDLPEEQHQEEGQGWNGFWRKIWGWIVQTFRWGFSLAGWGRV